MTEGSLELAERKWKIKQDKPGHLITVAPYLPVYYELSSSLRLCPCAQNSVSTTLNRRRIQNTDSGSKWHPRDFAKHFAIRMTQVMTLLERN